MITGGAGFIGSHLTEELLNEGNSVDVIDNLSSGNPDHIARWETEFKDRFHFFNLDLTHSDFSKKLGNYKTIFHLAANPEVRIDSISPTTHFEQNIIATFNLLQMAKDTKVKNLVFTSTSTVYGDAKTIPTPETYAPLKPISTYGGSKLACEALISSFSFTYGISGVIFRLANIIGPNSTHGVIFDFVKKLTKNPTHLEILGDGSQNKSYLHVNDLIDAMKFGLQKNPENLEILNIGSDDQVDVDTIAKLTIETMGLENIEISYTGGVDGGRGWKGDVKNMLLDINKIKSLGWNPKYNSQEAIQKTLRKII